MHLDVVDHYQAERAGGVVKTASEIAGLRKAVADLSVRNDTLVKQLVHASRPRLSSSRVVQVIQTVVMEGAGNEADPFREVVYYYHFNGSVICRHDQAATSTTIGPRWTPQPVEAISVGFVKDGER